MEGPGPSLSTVHLPRDKNSPVLTHISPQLVPKPLPAVMLRRLQYSVKLCTRREGKGSSGKGNSRGTRCSFTSVSCLGPPHRVMSPPYR